MRASLAIVYLPAATLPVLSFHNAYLPVLVPVVPTSTDQAGSVLRHAAEDDWELLGVPADKTIFLTSDKTPISNADALSHLEPRRAFEVIHHVLVVLPDKLRLHLITVILPERSHCMCSHVLSSF